MTDFLDLDQTRPSLHNITVLEVPEMPLRPEQDL